MLSLRKSPALSFDDVLIVPKYSEINSRSDINLNTSISLIDLTIPIISANMSSISEYKMLKEMSRLGGLGILHRFQTIDEMGITLSNLQEMNVKNYGFSFGVGYDWKERVRMGMMTGASIACLDVAHADQKQVLDVIEEYWQYAAFPLIVGNIVTTSSAQRIIAMTPKHNYPLLSLKIGIGGGSCCSTRLKTGCGYPQLQAILDIAEYIKDFYPEIKLIGDGSCRTAGDISKCLAAGSDAVMLGNILSATNECPGEVRAGMKEYRGSASEEDKKLRNQFSYIEGESAWLPCKGPVENIINDLCNGVRSGLSYVGSKNIKEFQENSEFVLITNAGIKESAPYILCQ